MYVNDLSGLGHLGKKRGFKKIAKKITKIAKPVVRAAAAYYTGGASEIAYRKMQAAKKAASAPAPIYEPAPPPPEAPPPAAAPQTPTEAIATAARTFFASRLPAAFAPAPQQPRAAEIVEAPAAETAQPARPKLGKWLPFAAVAAAVPLFFILLGPRGSGRRR